MGGGGEAREESSIEIPFGTDDDAIVSIKIPRDRRRRI